MSEPTRLNASARRILLPMALLFLGPLLVAFLLYYASGWRPSGHTNHGSLIDPPRPLSGGVFVGKWSMVYVGDARCDTPCRKTLYFMRQTHLSLGNLYPRVQRVFVATSSDADSRDLKHDYPALIMVNATNHGPSALLDAFPIAQRATGIFIVDPRGNLMMRYDVNASPEGLLADLKQLLGLSSIG